MNIYLATVKVDNNVKDPVYASCDYDVKRYNVAPELLTVTIMVRDQSGSSFTFRLLRDDYDLFRQKIIECEGYPK